MKGGEKMSVSHGVNEYNFDGSRIAGKTVGEVIGAASAMLNIGGVGGHNNPQVTLLDGKQVDMSQRLTGNEQKLEVIKNAGKKG